MADCCFSRPDVDGIDASLELLQELYESRGRTYVAVVPSPEPGTLIEGQMACYHACFEMAKNDTDWFIVIVRTHANCCCDTPAPCRLCCANALVLVRCTPPRLPVFNMFAFARAACQALPLRCQKGFCGRLLPQWSELVHGVFSRVQDDDEFAVPAGFGIIPDYLDSLDDNVGQVVAPALRPALPHLSHCQPASQCALYADGNSHTSAVFPAAKLQPRPPWSCNGLLPRYEVSVLPPDI